MRPTPACSRIAMVTGARWIGVQNGHGVFEAGAGHWTFIAQTA
jgi:hypothetical protein